MDDERAVYRAADGTVPANGSGRILLLLYNCSVHDINPQQTNVELHMSPPNSTCKTQTLDMRITANFKLCYKHRVTEQVLCECSPYKSGSSTSLTRTGFSMTVQMMYAAWHEVARQRCRTAF